MAGPPGACISVFAVNDEGYRKRRKAYIACRQCKQARRRCKPSPDGSSQCAPCQELNLPCSLAPELSVAFSMAAPQEKSSNLGAKYHTKTENDETFFISSLDPSSEFVSSGNPDRDHVGVWVSRGHDSDNSKAVKYQVPIPATLDKHLLVHMNSLHAFEFPDTAIRNGLIHVYFNHIQRLLPIIDQARFQEQLNTGTYSVPLLHAILMVAGRHTRSTRYLKMMGTDHRNFAVTCVRKIKSLLYALIETDSLTLSRIHALLTLHCEGPDGFLDAAHNLCNAFHYAHSVGIHLRKDVRDQPNDTTNLWWSLWCLDRMSTCMNGGPLNSYSQDVSLTLDECPPTESDAYRLAKACEAIDKAITLYRPMGKDNPIPEDIIAYSTQAVYEDDGTLINALIRLIMVTSVVLSYKRAVVVAADKSVPLSLISWCMEIYDIMDKYQKDMPPMAFVPYMITITFTVFLKCSTLDYIPIESRSAWKGGVELLDKMSEKWWIAEAMSSMAKRVFEKLPLESVASVTADSREVRDHTQAPDQNQGQNQDQSQNQHQNQNQDQSQNQLSSQDNAHPHRSHSQQSLPLDIFSLERALFSNEHNENQSSFLGQTELFSELDRGVVDLWFPGL